jgi:hypothetical protein
MQPLENPAAESELRSVSAANELDRQLRRAERELRKLACGVSARVVLRSGIDEEGAGDWQQSLCFGKLYGEWRMYLEAGLVEHSETNTRAEVFSADLETRVLVAKRVPALVEALRTQELQRDRPLLDSTARELGKFIDQLSARLH